MDARPNTADSKHHYPPHLQLWNRSISSPAVPKLATSGLHTAAVTISVTNTSVSASTSAGSSSTISPRPGPDLHQHLHLHQQPHSQHLHSPHSAFPTHIDLLPILFPQQNSLYHAQLLQYNKLIAPGRGRGGGLQTTPLPPLLSTPSVQVGQRSRSSSNVKVSNKDSSRAKPGTQNCHGNRGAQNNNTSKGDRAGIAPNDKMPPPRRTAAAAELAHPLPSRPAVAPSTSPTNLTAPAGHSNSVPSTPHQHPRKFVYESREPSPNATQGHSPRSAYSETNGNVPSLRPLPPRQGGCKFETAVQNIRRRIPYSIGAEKLEASDVGKIQSKLSEGDERRLTTDMRELYDRLKPTAAVEEKRHQLVQKLEKMLNNAWPGCNIRVNLFGSSGNLLCTDDSDVDICIETTWKELDKPICKLAELLAKNGMQKVTCVSSAKVPIVKVWDPELELACDMNVNNTLALENTRMIRTYIEIDERVRPLAMIIKHWTRRRVINDAAFGGTLSSYTWICMIIAFLQLRQPPILPSLHQRPHLKKGKKEGDIAPFGDDLDRLRGHGDPNKSTLGELLFEFFRFYAHEFDYDNSALSVRLGKLMPKSDRKNWILAINNRLCVEEPFNTMRNLGNTADDTSFRGIHLELRRAFELVAAGQLEECCEQYVFPKEEEKPFFQKPASVPRPALLRSASQTNQRSNGNTRRGGRQQGQFRGNNNHGNNRRASSSTTYDNNANVAYYQGYPYVATSDGMFTLAQTLSELQLQENQLRFLQYTQSQALAQQQQVFTHAQRMQGNASQPQTSTERSRTNSFDNPPLTAPIRPEMWYWQQFQGQPYYAAAQPSFTSYPSSPSNQQPAEQLRGSHRSSTTSEAGTAASGSALRSHSQPASRSVPGNQAIPGVLGQIPTANGTASIPTQQLNGRAIPSFIPDENNDTEQGPNANSNHTPPGEEKHYGQHLDVSMSPAAKANGVHNGLPAFGDIGIQGSRQNTEGRRRLSSEQFPQSILNRIKRTSRSPSPLGHNRTYSAGTGSTPLVSAPLPASASKSLQDMKPLVVNGSGYKPSSAVASRKPSAGESANLPDVMYDHPVHVTQPLNGALVRPDLPLNQPVAYAMAESRLPERPLVVNGSCPAPTVLRNGLEGPMTPNGSLSASSYFPVNSSPMHSSPLRISPATFQRGLLPEHLQSPLTALDLATDRMHLNDPHLSPINEATPSPTANRKFDLPPNLPRTRPGPSSSGKESRHEAKSKQKAQNDVPATKLEAAHASNPRHNGHSREHGHTRGAKSESDNTSANGWQKISKGKKRGIDMRNRSEAFPQSELPPKNDSERKGG
ncbi:hypothetical protein BKA67DRAFT_174301 [Truncatella angustata]|uniref:polynucleotide adenylyltransferase n=1 Tax=Truncatella angustata TaxID=152316 RepID=A0A9P8URI4_9PEZI|nr:uncharacterized protein BKA67DRAFT_174301 [Truncatella angustata]KAH6656904.1 hypothetical protein BKA67DRAFT_174301 [Truncatella angustata]